MNFKFYNELCELLKDFFSEIGLESQEDGIFLNDGFAVKIDYDDNAKLIVLKAAKPQEGEQLEFITLSQYLFDDSHTKKDLGAVAIDFEETIREEIGAKRKINTSKIAMPKAERTDAPNIEAFTKVFLDICPQYRENYKTMVALNGKFLPVSFYLECGREKMIDLANNGTEKQISKFLNFLNKYYIEGENQVVAIITTIILGGSFYDKKELFNEKILPFMQDMNFLKMAAINSIDNSAKDKKLQNLF